MANTKENKVEASFMRIIAVLLGVFGAGWLFNDGWQGVFDFFTSYKLSENFFDHFFNTGLFPVLTLSISLLFLIISLRDLEILSKGFAVFTAILSIIVFIIYVYRFIVMIKNGYVFDYSFLIVCGQFFLIVGYFTFSMYSAKKGNLKNISWVVSLISLAVILAGGIWGYFTKEIFATEFIKMIFTTLSHVAIFYCGLRKY